MLFYYFFPFSVVPVEHKEGVEDIDSILEVPGIDSVVIGPYDLSGSMGILGQLQHPNLLSACRHIVERCKARKIPCGASIGPGNQEILNFWLGLKPDFLFCGDELSFVKAGTESTISKIKEMRNIY